jgi:hypothetical protein
MCTAKKYVAGQDNMQYIYLGHLPTKLSAMFYIIWTWERTVWLQFLGHALPNAEGFAVFQLPTD